ncbi:HNH endonuclease [Serratia marcescens]|uniref:HNH endonuclease n=1 Tax=Serratia marcescens TaxID=615 RepID=UPI0021BD7441|nr:HNH endonuclease signature motif containing protein [Serratia marcescens]
MVAKYSAIKKSKVLAKTGGRCTYCGVLLSSESLTIDHVISKRMGGDNSVSNLLACCRPCNAAKGTKTMEQWRRFYSIKLVTGKTIFGQEQVDYLFRHGLFSAIGACESFQFYFQTGGDQ